MAICSGRPSHLLVDNRAAVLWLRQALSVDAHLRRRPWQLRPNGDIQHAIEMALARVGRA
eukprot:1292290-Alexandrium_andersonii.AAC.1